MRVLCRKPLLNKNLLVRKAATRKIGAAHREIENEERINIEEKSIEVTTEDPKE
ncbi:hypothetical protein [Cytobacillus sp.]|uniref:hypothetical protein n=1 Tax=Cytobacillus sp. TaxID=2675269 RepID=UPI003514F92F